jgi:hypothetical protein
MFQYVISEGTDRPICYCQSLTKILRKHEEIHSMNIPKWKCNSKKKMQTKFSTLKAGTYHQAGIVCIGGIEVIGYQTLKLCVVFFF